MLPIKAQDKKEKTDELSFSLLPLRKELLTNLVSLNYKDMTAVQKQSLPVMLQGLDVITQAKTGSGKTAAFGLVLLNLLNINWYAIQSLVICPTRELAEQVTQALRKLARTLPNIKILNLSGGIPMTSQTESLKYGAHIVVGTPGRLQKHLTKGSLSLQNLKLLVLDEADRMLDMGFFNAIQQIISHTPLKRQTLLFSATYPPQIKELASKFLCNPQIIVIEEEKTDTTIEQCFFEVARQADKFSLLKTLLLHHQPSSTLIFCNTKEQTSELTSLLAKEGFYAMALHGDMDQSERDLTLIRFANYSCPILVATDVAARGLDIEELAAVINYDLAFEPEVHIHRIGRTGRAEKSGKAFSITTPADASRLLLIEEQLGFPLPWGDINKLNKKSESFNPPQMVTLSLTVGKKDKIRPSDIVGTLTKGAGLAYDSIGKINIATFNSYVAIVQEQADKVCHYLQTGKLKGRKVGVRKLK
ncbi:ATP-dependent RNA helicase [Legionella busanensis]|uniref:ATP-dependent RNA helicase n=1 Tax=Legionella busanensis TaxID=190655 RepID=A0A378JQ81_9GAMM|nr:ATP-dependent RNA helicase DbpA [Legionella busanensis]STX52329.1 ATP-dependent RNA helicase [Legionella busanensis]